MATYDAANEEPESYITVTRIYKPNDDLSEKQDVLFDFQVSYTLAPEVDSDGEEDLENLETRSNDPSLEFDKQWLLGGDTDNIKAISYLILDMIEVPCYRDVVETLIDTILELKELDQTCELQKIEKVRFEIGVTVWRFPGEDEDDDMNVTYSVAPSSDEAVMQHLETVVIEKEGHCVICMDKIVVGSDVATVRMPCLHVYHRTCAETWLRRSGICPLCRFMIPS